MSIVPLPAPEFISRDPAAITRELIEQYEMLTGRPLQPAQVERVLIDLFAYRESLLRIAIQEAASQNLVAFARYPMLDYLGELVGTPRLPPSAAGSAMEFVLSAARTAVTVVPSGTRIQAPDGFVFATDQVLEILPGAVTGIVQATATVPGIGGNGYVAGTISVILDPIPYVASGTNTATTDGGAEIEDDARYRERIRKAPERFSVAGSAEAYRFHALSVSPAIADVAVSNPLMGVVRLHVLAQSGLPSQSLLTDVYDAVTSDRVRPLSDTVEVVAPVEVPYEITATVRPLAHADPLALLAAVQSAATSYAADRRAKLGRDVIPSQVVAALSVPGTYDVVLTSPAAPIIVQPGEWANATAISILQGSSADG